MADTDDDDHGPVELLVVIDRSDWDKNRERADNVSGFLEREIDSVDEMGDGIDLLLHYPTIEEAEAAETKLQTHGFDFVQSVTVNYGK